MGELRARFQRVREWVEHAHHKVAQLCQFLIERFYVALARYTARHPYRVIAVCVLAVLVGGAGITQIKFSRPFEELYLPGKSTAFRNAMFVTDEFGELRPASVIVTAKDGGDVLRLPVLLDLLKLHREILALNVVVSPETGKALSQSDIDDGVHGVTVSYDHSCFRVLPLMPCQSQSVLEFWQFSEETLRQDTDIHGTVSKPPPPESLLSLLKVENVTLSHAVTDPLDYGLKVLGGLSTDNLSRFLPRLFNDTSSVVGGMEFDKTNPSRVVKAHALRQTYFLLAGPNRKEHDRAWELAFVQLTEPGKYESINVFRETRRSGLDAALSGIPRAAMLFSLCVAVMLAYVSLSLGPFNLVRSHILLGVGAITSIVASMALAFGICGYLDVPFSPIVLGTPFLIIGIGVDDAYLEVAEFDRTPASWSIERRLIFAFRAVGGSITMTSITDFFAFAISASNIIPAISGFCVFCAVSVLCDFILQITLFAAFIVLDARRIKSNRYDVVPWIVKGGAKPRTSTHVQYSVLDRDHDIEQAAAVDSTNNNNNTTFLSPPDVTHDEGDDSDTHDEGDDSDTHDEISDDNDESDDERDAMVSVTDEGKQRIASPHASAGETEHDEIEFPDDLELDAQAYKSNKVSYVLAKYVGPGVIHPIGQGVVLFITLVMLILGVVGMFSLRDSASTHMAEPDDSYWIAYRDTQDKYFPNDDYNLLIVFKEFDYSDEANQDKMLQVFDELQHHEKTHGPYENWLRDFLTWLPTSRHADRLSKRGRPKSYTDFYLALYEWLLTPSRMLKYMSTISFEFGMVSASRFGMRLTPGQTDLQKGAILQELYEITDKSDLPVFPFAVQFLHHEQFVGLIERNLLNFAYVAMALLVLTLLFVESSLCTAVILGTIVLIDIDMFFVMYVWNIGFTNVSVTLLLLSLGLAIDSVAHISHAYMEILTAVAKKRIASGYEQDEQERGKQRRYALLRALAQTGASVFSGSATSFLGILALGFAPQEVLREFCKFFVAMFMLAMVHGLFFVPVLLYRIDPPKLALTQAGANRFGGRDGDVFDLEDTDATLSSSTVARSDLLDAPRRRKGGASIKQVEML